MAKLFHDSSKKYVLGNQSKKSGFLSMSPGNEYVSYGRLNRRGTDKQPNRSLSFACRR